MKTIEQTVTFAATPHEVYDALMSSKKHAAFTGAAAKISDKKGGKFSAYDGYCEGVNLALTKDKKIVQTWRASDWPDDHFSKVTFALSKTASGTKIVFTQTDVPEKQARSIAKGWTEFYWNPLRTYLEKLS